MFSCILPFFLNLQFINGIEHPQQLSRFSFLKDIQMLLHIHQGVKASAEQSEVFALNQLMALFSWSVKTM
jgi:hypothetical protein